MVCPHHKTGIFGLLFYYIVLFYQPVLHGTSEQNNYNKRVLLFLKQKFMKTSFFPASYLNLEMNLYFQFFYFLYIGASLYTLSFLPYGRFYNRLGGNVGMLSSYLYIFMYLAFPIFRRPLILELYLYYFYNKINFLLIK